MLAKKTSKNQITLPKRIVRQFPEAEYFDVSVRDGEVVLRPVTISAPGERLKAVREKIPEKATETQECCEPVCGPDTCG